MSDGKSFKPAWNIFNHHKLRLTGEPWQGGKDRPSLSFAVVNNNPRFRLYMNDGRKDSSPIPFALDPYIFTELAHVIRHVVSKKEQTRYTFELKASYDHKGGKTDKPAPIAKIYVGRDGEGAVYIAFHAKEEPLAKFVFTPSYYAELLDASGEKVSKEFGSEMRALAWADVLTGLMTSFMVVHGKEPAEKPGSGGGNNRKTGGWGKPAEKASDSWSDDDVGF